MTNIYLTCNDAPSGIFKSQVVDVVETLNKLDKKKWKLVSLIPIKEFWGNRKKIKKWDTNAWIFPMIPSLKFFQLNAVWLFTIVLLLQPQKIFARSVFATNLALRIKDALGFKVIYDGRGAFYAECEEYGMVNPSLLPKIKQWEGRAVLQSDFRNAVSHRLVEYWREEYKYLASKHVVIPCTLASHFENVEISERDKTIDFVYAGGLGEWQSLKGVEQFIRKTLDEGKKWLFLSRKSELIEDLTREFPTQLTQRFVSPEEVPHHMKKAHFGLLVRPTSVTNSVASPTKFAEYLACGCTPLLSKELGDFSDFLKRQSLGYLIEVITQIKIEPKPIEKLQSIAYRCFSKQSNVITNELEQIIN